MKLPLLAISFFAVSVQSSLNVRRSQQVLVSNETYCKHSADDDNDSAKCPLGPQCTPYRSLEYCEHSFPSLIKTRKDFIQASPPSQLDSEGWWFPNLDDKMAGYVYAASSGYNVPQVYSCTSDITGGLDEYNTNNNSDGFVIRATGQHSSQGVYALPDGFGGIEKIRGITMTLEDVKTDLLDIVKAEGIVIEEYVSGPGGELPTEYKFHMFNGEVGSISVVHGRGTGCGCWAEIDVDGERLDQYGCFASAGVQRNVGECTAIDFDGGARGAYEVKGFGLCSSLPEIQPCLLQDMIALAKKVSLEIGVYARVDMFAMSDNFYLQEFSTNHMNGARHCTARLDENDCIDSCFQGNMWNDLASASNFTMGGPKTPIPNSQLASFLTTEGFDAKCNIVTSLTPSLTASSCLELAPPTEPVSPPTFPPVVKDPISPVAAPTAATSEAPSIKMKGSFVSEMSAPPSSEDDQPMPFFCPIEKPNGNTCALPEMLDCFYDQECCSDGSCEYTTSCNCVNGTFACTQEPGPVCQAQCPNQAPSSGDLCQNPTSDFHCPYDETCCDGTPLCFVATSCRCVESEDIEVGGIFECLLLPVDIICSLERTSTGDYQAPQQHTTTQSRLD